jgi:hypothetical protein
VGGVAVLSDPPKPSFAPLSLRKNLRFFAITLISFGKLGAICVFAYGDTHAARLRRLCLS